MKTADDPAGSATDC